MTDDLCLLGAHTCSSPPGEKGASRRTLAPLGPRTSGFHLRARPAPHHRSASELPARFTPPATGRPGRAKGRNPLGPRRSGQQNPGVTCRQSPWRWRPWPISCPGPGWGVWRKDSQNPSSGPECRSYLVTTPGGSGEGRGRRGSPTPQAAYACAARPLCARAPGPSAHARSDQLALRRHRPACRLLVALGDPLSQIVAIVFRLGP